MHGVPFHRTADRNFVNYEFFFSYEILSIIPFSFLHENLGAQTTAGQLQLGNSDNNWV